MFFIVLSSPDHEQNYPVHFDLHHHHHCPGLDHLHQNEDHLLQKVHTFQASLEAVLAQLCDAEFAQVLRQHPPDDHDHRHYHEDDQDVIAHLTLSSSLSLSLRLSHSHDLSDQGPFHSPLIIMMMRMMRMMRMMMVLNVFN